jgi:hypothetical protein
MAKRPYLDDLQTARLWAKVKALVSPLSSRVTTLEGQVQTNTTDLSGVVVTGVWNESQGRIEF